MCSQIALLCLWVHLLIDEMYALLFNSIFLHSTIYRYEHVRSIKQGMETRIDICRDASGHPIVFSRSASPPKLTMWRDILLHFIKVLGLSSLFVK